MADMLLQSPGENQNVVQIDKHKLIKEVPEHVIDKPLKDSGGFSEPEWHH